MTSAADPATAIRSYLLWLEDPSSVLDEAAIKKAEAAVAKAQDPLDRLLAAASLERARQADGSEVEKAFIAHAQAYAEAENIPVSAFQQMGVPTKVLTQAGLVAGNGTSRQRANTPSGTRAPKVPVERLQSAALQLSGQFTLADVAEKAGGGSPATVRKAVEALVESGRLITDGALEGHRGRGRAPSAYRLA
jgi:hypothetical protein